MAIENLIRERLVELINRASGLSVGNQNDQCTDSQQRADCSAWITAAQNAVHIVIPQPDAPYRMKADRIATDRHGLMIHRAVNEFSSVLSSLIKDAESGLLASVADNARAETFDDFLDHAVLYLKESKKQESGVIAGVVFEDALRRICKKLGIVEKGVKIDKLISELTTQNELTAVKAKRARAAADVRTKATHAQWNEFEIDDVKSTIEFTRELIDSKLT